MNKGDIDFAKFCFENKQYEKAKEIFLNNDMLYEAGFCALLSGNLKSSRLILNEINDPSSASEWGLIILDIIEKKPYVKKPAYFQTRAFLEVYLNLLIENEFYEWADNIINAYKFFTRANAEVPKFIARVLSAWGYFSLVHEFSTIAKRICYYDPEIHFIEAEAYLTEEKFKEAYLGAIETLKIAPGYFPAEKLKKMIENAGFMG